jgi:hypothetical protein
MPYAKFRPKSSMPSSVHLEDLKIDTRTLGVLKSFFGGRLLGGKRDIVDLMRTYRQYKVKERTPSGRVGKIVSHSQHGFLRSLVAVRGISY